MTRLFCGLLASILLCAGAQAQSVSAGVAASSTGGASVTTSDKNCKTVYLKPGETPPGGAMSSTVTASNGEVSGSTTGPNSVTVHSSNGNTSSSVTTSGSGTSSVVVGAGTGHCTIYITRPDHN